MTKIAILCDSDPFTKPRPSRMIEMLEGHYDLYVFGKGVATGKEGIRIFSFPNSKSAAQRTAQEEEELRNLCRQREFAPLIFTPNRLVLQSRLMAVEGLEILIVEDITLLPFAVEYKERYGSCKIVIDLREFYPLEYENDRGWQESFGLFFEYLCGTYLPYVDWALSVSEGLIAKYKEVFGLECELFLSLPPLYDLHPQINSHLELVYHGLISPDRESENLLQIASLLNKGIYLNLMVLSNQDWFLQEFKKEAQKRSNVRILEPVKLEEIIPRTNAFDLGLITLQNNGFNNTNALPNKFFEYIQARLGVISTPLPCVRAMIEEYQIGVVSEDYAPLSVAKMVNALSGERVLDYKRRAHQVSATLSLKANQVKILSRIKALLEEGK
ncbi:hypothetical protein BBW65_04970 [Helicobacter enhydrae]|uniref:Capsular biosynthesis protein n=1 Tax=Helicobacter enhydrae TaxID=222136 RepID=A0A1B1U610_9HELI|nr:hypothetical protein [Helicobacter enhydrae]ANV98188.1 hypothetical protein BBW65_04970 [Helicobacter enhydrae]